MKNINSLIGQNLAKEQISGLFQSSLLGGPIHGPIKPRLVAGPSGTGKSRLIEEFSKDIAEHGIETITVDASSLGIQTSSAVPDLITGLNASQSGPICLVVDECQKVCRGSSHPSAMERDITQFVFPHGVRVQERVTGKVCGKEVTADFRNLILIFATNEKESLESAASRKKGEAPFARRFSEIELSNYSQDEMEQIIPLYFSSLGYRIGESASGLVRRLHRGNMEALTAVGERVREHISGKTTLNKEEVIKCCKMTKFLPRGLRKPEAKLLDILRRENLPKAIAAAGCGLHGALLDSAIAHLKGQFADLPSGERIYSPLITFAGSKLSITDFGKKYMLGLEKEGFTW